MVRNVSPLSTSQIRMRLSLPAVTKSFPFGANARPPIGEVCLPVAQVSVFLRLQPRLLQGKTHRTERRLRTQGQNGGKKEDA